MIYWIKRTISSRGFKIISMVTLSLVLVVMYILLTDTGSVSGVRDKQFIRLMKKWPGLFETLSKSSYAELYGLRHIVRKSAHFVMFFGFSFLFFIQLVICKVKQRYSYAIVFFIALGFALFSEYMQTQIPGRNGGLFDVIIDMAGAVCALLLMLIVRLVTFLCIRAARLLKMTKDDPL